MKIVGFVCYKHVPDAKIKKLDDISRVMLLVGYHNTSAYKLYCLVTNKVEFNRVVIVKVSEARDWSKSQSNSSVVPTSEDTSESKGSEDESESEDDSEGDSEGEPDSEDESDSEGESDSDIDSDGDSDSRNISDYEGGHTYEGDTFGVPTSDIVPASEEDYEQVQRP
ncbi:uncharacterized protein LOC127079188 [Lathyrus oleraceus]|uniref:uncharacterized protein LOC127079188 n=1 Tax=Pisum sativum TaxID=3888 RepID=UPI0021D05DA1|nr:uncharacterized protein LOC127079188 [Pisum sativum]